MDWSHLKIFVVIAETGIYLEFILADSMEELDSRASDISIRFIEPSDTDLTLRRVGTIRFGLYASTGYIKKNGMPRHEETAQSFNSVALSHRPDTKQKQVRNGGTDILGFTFSGCESTSSSRC